MTEKELIRRIKQGEKELFEILVKQYYQAVYHFCYYRTGNQEMAYDCTQETFLHVIRFFDSYVDHNHFKAWVLGIARNVCNDSFRGRTADIIGDECLESEPVTETGFHRVEMQDSVANALDQLPDIQKDVIILRFFYDMKLKEIAGIVGIGVPTAKSRLKQGMEKLKRYFEKEGEFL